MEQHAVPQAMVQRAAQAAAFAVIHAIPVIPIMVRSAARMYPMVQLLKIAAQPAALHATADITNPAVAVWLMNVQAAQPNVQTMEQQARNRHATMVSGEARAIVRTAIHATVLEQIAAAV